ncbi:MAG TPA: discoidin domain-containing protein, partial [Rugosimonospora sp.]|nr:discoidin domain-containing protein [Rugosimonospora sp.]
SAVASTPTASHPQAPAPLAAPRTADPRATGNPAAAPALAVPGQVNASGRDLALGGLASASSVEPPGVFVVSNAFDGDPDTRWGSAFQSDPQWIAVDLGSLWRVTQVELSWERAYATAYHVDVSADGTAWRTVYATTTGSGGDVRITIPRTPARYVRMVGTARAQNLYGYSLYEFEVR